MKIYAIGGSVRDELLERPVHDYDYVVVGSTVDEMLEKGFKQVGTDFPVFLHPETGDEYALARKEVSTGKGYCDFKFDFNSNITLKEDCERRDFTINQICKDLETGEIIDHFNGLTDLKNKVIRHINSEHFIEDPLRVLRCFRFATQLDFMVSEDTLILCRDMVHEGMIEHLTPERVWKEIEKALQTKRFDLFIHYLDVTDALSVILQEVAELKNVPENTAYHPEGNAYKHVLLTLKEVNTYDKEGKDLALINFALLCHDLGKALTDKTEWPAHHGHDDLGLSLIDGLCDRLKVPNDYRDFAKLFCKNHMKFYNFLERSVKTQYDNIEEITKFKDENKLNLVQICHACDKLGREGFVKEERIDLMLRVFTRQNIIFTILKDKGLKDLPKETQEHLSQFKGEKFGKLYRDAKISYLKGKLNEKNNSRGVV